MPRYVVERTFPEGFGLPAGDEGAAICMAVVERNADAGVTWVHSYVSADKAKTFCVYDAPTPEAVRKTAAPERPPGRQHHGGPRARPVLLQLEEELR